MKPISYMKIKQSRVVNDNAINQSSDVDCWYLSESHLNNQTGPINNDRQQDLLEQKNSYKSNWVF